MAPIGEVVSCRSSDAGWSSLVARRAHNPKVVGSNPTPATIETLVGASCKAQAPDQRFRVPGRGASEGVWDLFLGNPTDYGPVATDTEIPAGIVE